ncbi:P-loop containing nucleoside triphosphate hydrolase protein [Aspergillus bertholletiae]|uniref:P-loop containing nucleoside triphosphate hydrolase protein n=1 Tax=Aspergillus bertholletiae TaxID=1226010 RepID=A0A5N7B3E0_9EURO|nr:P-loop containing nucleoside triphosphate hydrolase protein [Aspergillus bertholletiae]
MSPVLDDQAMHQLQSQQSKLLDKIDELRAIGVGGLVELPQLIVCGNQSSGKSSVLEAISRVRFPAKSNICTRFATEVILRRGPKPKIKVSIEPGDSRTNEAVRQKLRNFTPEAFSSSEDLPMLIEQAKEHMGINEDDTANSGFSDDVLKVEISGPDKPELTLVDLPGLYYSTSRDQGAKGITIVRNLTEKYMKNTRTIILAVISAKTDYHLQEVLNIAERFDSKRERTLGVVTQPDILEVDSEEESNYLQFIRNEKISLRLGWHALRNRSFETRDISDDARDELEKAFFEQGRWASLSRDNVGIDSLRRRLSTVLLQHVRRNLPGLITDLRDKIADRQHRLTKLGAARSTLQQQRGFLLGVSSRFELITSQALNGMYSDHFFGGFGDDTQGLQDFRRLRAVIRELNECFADAMNTRGARRVIKESPLWTFDLKAEKMKLYMDDWSPDYITREALEAEISEQARKNRGIELPGTANQLLVGSLFRDQSRPWEDIARRHLLNTWESAKYFVCLLLQHLTDEHTYMLLLGTALAPQLEQMKEGLLNKLGELTAYMKRGHPLPVGGSFLSSIQQARTKRQIVALRKGLDLSEPVLAQPDNSKSFNAHDLERAASELQSSSDQFAAAEIIDQMQAYYETSIVTFVDNIAVLAIENCLLEPLERIFTSQTVNDMEDQQIRELAEEPVHVQRDRQRLNQELDRLRAGLNTFNILSTESSSLQRPPIFMKPALAPQPPAAPVPTPITLRQKSETKLESPSVPAMSSSPAPLLPGGNNNSNTTAASTQNPGPASGTPSSSSTRSLFGEGPTLTNTKNANPASPLRRPSPANTPPASSTVSGQPASNGQGFTGFGGSLQPNTPATSSTVSGQPASNGQGFTGFGGSLQPNTPATSSAFSSPSLFPQTDGTKPSAGSAQSPFQTSSFGKSGLFGATNATTKYDPKQPPTTMGFHK